MSAGLNKVLLIGELGRDPELRHASNGRAVASFSLGVQRAWEAGSRDRQDQTEWFHVVAWGALAESCQTQLAAGQTVFVEGRLKNRHWRDAEGHNHSSVEVVASQLSPLSPHHQPEEIASVRAGAPDNGV